MTTVDAYDVRVNELTANQVFRDVNGDTRPLELYVAINHAICILLELRDENSKPLMQVSKHNARQFVGTVSTLWSWYPELRTLIIKINGRAA